MNRKNLLQRLFLSVGGPVYCGFGGVSVGVGEIPGERIGKEGIKRFKETLSHSLRNESKISPKSRISPSQYLRPLVACP